MVLSYRAMLEAEVIIDYHDPSLKCWYHLITLYSLLVVIVIFLMVGCSCFLLLPLFLFWFCSVFQLPFLLMLWCWWFLRWLLCY